MIMCVSAVSAADDASDDLAASDEDAVSVSNDDIVSASDSNTVLSAGEANFNELQGNITGKTGTVDLSSDFKRNSTENSPITVDNNNLVINGNGKIIDNSGSGEAIFAISGNNVTLKDMTLINATVAIQNAGNLTLDHVTFTGCKVITSHQGSQLTISDDSVFGDGDIVLQSDAELLSQAQIIVAASPETIVLPATTSALSAQAYVNGKKIVVDDTLWEYFEGSNVIANPSAYNPSELGTYEIKATHATLSNAECDNVTVKFTSGSKYDSIITIDVIPVNPVYNGEVVIKVTVENKTGQYAATPTGNVEFEISDVSLGPLTLVNGTANYTMSNAAVKTYSVFARYLGDDNFKTNFTSKAFEVNPKTPDIKIDVDTSKFQNQTITITLPGDATGSVTVEINDDVVVDNGVLVAGVYSFNTAYLVNANPYKINVTFTSTNSNYTNNKNSTTFKVDQFTTPINITLGKYKYNEDVSFDIELASDITGENVNVTVKNAAGIIFNENITLTDGKATVNLGKIAAGNYDINVTFEGNTKYAPAVNDTVKLFVNKTAPIITVVSIDNQVLFEDVEINVTVQNATKGTAIKLYVNNVENATATVDENGTATFKCKFVESAGTFPITVKYMGDNNLTEGNVTDNVVLAKVTPEINATVGVVYIGSNAVISVNLTNCDTNYYPLGVIQYVLGGYSGTVSLVNGKVDITIPKENLDQVTSYTVTISYLKDASEKRYNDNSTEFTFDVVKYTPSIKVDANNNVVTENATIDVEFTSDNLAGDVTVTVVIKSNGAEPTTKNLVLKYQSAEKKANGTLSIKLPLGTQSVNVTFGENTTTYSAYNDTCTFEVTKDKPVIDMNITNKTDVITEIAYPNNATVNFTSNVDGDYKLYVNDQLVNSGSFVAGKISNFTLPLYVVGDYTVNLTYVANGEYNETTITKTFEVKNGTITVSDVTALVVKYPNVTVVFIEANVDGDYNITVNNKNYTVTVKDGEGNKTLGVLDAGKYNVDLLSLVEYYDTVKATYTNVVEIQRGDIYFNVTVADVVYPNKAIAIVEASVDGNFTVNVNSKDYSVTVKDGKGNVTLDVLPVNKYEVSVKANASDASFNNWNTSGTNTTKFNVTNGTLAPTITVNSSVKYEDVIVVNITNAVDGTYNVNVNGTDYPISVSNGNGSTIIPTKNTLNVGTYTVNVTSTISNYNPFEDATHTVTVEKGIIYFSIAVDNVTFPTVPTVKFVTNVDGSLDDAYLIYIGNENITYVKVNGDTRDMYKFTPGNYTICVKPSNATDPKFANYDINTVNSTSFEVAYGKIDTLIVSVNNVDYPQNATITVTASVDGIYKVTIEGKDIEIPIVITGATSTTPVTNSSVNLPVLPVGTYTVNVTSLNENYTQTTNGSTFTVSNGTITPTISITPNPVAYSDAVVIEISNAVDGDYTVKINGTDYTVTVKDGKGNRTIETFNNLYAGSYNVNVTALIDNYNPFEDASKTLTVNKGTIHLNITVADVTYPNVATAVVFADMPGEYNITVYAFQGGAELYNYTVTIDTTPGQAASKSQAIGLLNASADYYIVVKSCDENYTGATNNTSFKVEKAVPVINISHEGDTLFENTTISVVVPYGTGKVTFYDKVIDTAHKLGEKDLVNNAANWTIENITVGTHTIYVVLSNDQNLQDDVKSTSFTIEKITPTITVTDNSTTYPDAVEIVVVLQNNGTTYAPTGSVGIVGDIQVAPEALVDGKCTFTVAGLAAGEYKINVTYYPNTDK
ncbi:Ig-like domain repeat protein, partial [Methanobrevibacter sp.]|uniref:Ig-like domain repeat protein n=1 Tax=Methanobrevibacter sp. TaxID=66852 RepID=UPI00386EB99F